MPASSVTTGKLLTKANKEKNRSVSDNTPSPVLTRSTAKTSAAIGSSNNVIENCSCADLENRLVEKIGKLFADLEAKFLSAFSDTINNLKSRVADLETQLMDLRSFSFNVEQNCEDIRRVSRLKDVVIKGVPPRTDKADKEIIREVSNIINHTLSPHFEAFRLKDKMRDSIIVKFPSQTEARSFITSFKNMGKFNLNKIDGFTSASPVYINESLTPRSNNIFREALRLRSAGRIAATFTRNGYIYVKNKPDDSPVKVSSLDQLKGIISPDSDGANITI